MHAGRRERLLSDLALPLPREITAHRFNAFDVRIDRVAKTVTLDVVFDVTPDRDRVVSIDALRRRAARPAPGAHPR